MARRWAPAAMHYLAAVLAVAAASVCSALLLPVLGPNILFVTYMAAVIVAAWQGGVRPALVATVLGYLVANLLLVPARDFFVVDWGVAAYFLGCASIAVLSETTRRARRRAETSASQVVSVVESIADGFIAVDHQWRCTYMNRAAEELARQSRQVGVGAMLWDAFPLATNRASDKMIKDAAANRQTVEFECFHEPWQTWFEVKVSPAEDRTLAIFFRDVTQRKLGQMALAQSEERLRLAQQGAHAGLWDWDMRTGRATWSDEYYEINGLDRATEPVRINFLRTIHADDRPGVERAIEAAIERGERIDVQYRIEHASLGLRWIAARGHTTRDRDGRALRTSGIVLDITERKQAEETLGFLSEAGNALSVLVDFESAVQSVARLAVQFIADYCVVVVSSHGRTERLATAHQDVAKEAVLRTMLAHDPLEAGSPAPVMQVLCTKSPLLVREVNEQLLDSIARDGDHRLLLAELDPVSWMIVPLLVRDKAIGAIELVSCQSRRRYTEEDLELAMELARRVAGAGDNVRLYTELRESERQKDDFLAMLAHELRNPLAAIQYANHLAKLTEKQRSPASEVIERQVKTLALLIDDLLDVSRITRDKIQLRKKIVDGSVLLERALTTVRPAIENRRHELAIERSAEPMPIYADAVRVEQILVNLLSNAAKYTPEGGRITARCLPLDGQAVFRIKDTGIGIPAQMLPRVFELFTQVDPSIDRSQGGLGIGLTVVRKLADMHGGSVSAASEGLGRGSEFTVRLPLCAKEPDAEKSAKGTLVSGPMRILVVDDNVDMAESLSRLLEQAGHTVYTAHDGHAALEAARSFAPDAILLDIGLPGLDGYHVAEALRRQPEFAGVRLVAISGYGQAEDRSRAKAAGFDEHLVKPVDFGQLAAMLWKD